MKIKQIENMENMRFKVGDRVRIKSIDWYNTSKNKYGVVELIGSNGWGFSFLEEMSALCGEVMTILNIGSSDCGYYDMKEDNGEYFWTDEMIECKVEESKPNIIEEAKTYWDSIKDAWICPNGYIFKDENGNIINATKIVLEKKKKEYPKTYEECCKVLNLPVRDLDILDNMLDTTEIIYNKNLDRLLNSFRKILVCRDAYWKIAGEEMGLGKPWEPDWNTSEPKYVIAYTSHGIEKQWEATYCKVFAFPTEEMRDAFYENFKEEIESCKELL